MDPAKSRKCLILFGLRDFEVGRMWMGKRLEMASLKAQSKAIKGL